MNPMKASGLSLWLAVLLSVPALGNPPGEQDQASPRPYGSRLSYAKARLQAHKNNSKATPPSRFSSYGLHSDVYGGLYTRPTEKRGQLDIYTGRAAVKSSLAIDSIGPGEAKIATRPVPIAQIESVTVRSHPWAEMLETVESPTLSKLFEYAPQDCFAALFRDADSIRRLDDSLELLSHAGEEWFGFSPNGRFSDRVAARLGVESFQILEPLLGETLFLSEDLDFYPNTNYALVFETSPLTAALPKSPTRDQIGDAFVLATSPELLEKIRRTGEKKLPSLAQAQDLQYCNAVLEARRDGFCYFSEAFIVKLVSPAYRINSSRRLAAIAKLVEHQYTVLAYRCLVGRWPTSLQEIAQEGYRDSKPLDDQFEILEDGTVKHLVWGTLFDIKPLSEVPIEQVSDSEKRDYESFRKRYDRLWTNFFDPVGVAFEVHRRLRVHTIVLPLVNSREYNLLEAVSGGDPIVFQGLQDAIMDRPLGLHGKLNWKALWLGVFGSRETGAENEERREKAVRQFNEKLRKEFSLPGDFDLFALLGDEYVLTHDGLLFADAHPERGIVLSLELAQPDAFQQVASLVTNKYFHRQEFSTEQGEYLSIGGRHGGTPYAYACYRGKFLHLSLAERPIRELASLPPNQAPSAGVFDRSWIGVTGNNLVRADLRRFPNLLQESADRGVSYYLKHRLRDALTYRYEQLTVENEAGPAIASRFFRHPPRSSQSSATSSLTRASVSLTFTPEGLSTRLSVNNPAFPDTVNWFRD